MKIKEHAAKSKRIGIRIIDTDEEQHTLKKELVRSKPCNHPNIEIELGHHYCPNCGAYQ
ncbi:hypothetical protein LCGC14_1366420 [marine sediment metagenome]|uniref:Uncharacterized protein n=1 Tax=marine sediment metagenome TaxID=412755 RepID=A0A0F9K758_9ZZZZ